MQFEYNPTTLFHKYDSLHKGSKPSLGKLKVLIKGWNLPKAIEGAGVKAGIKAYLWKKYLELLSTEICHRNCQRTQQESEWVTFSADRDINGTTTLPLGCLNSFHRPCCGCFSPHEYIYFPHVFLYHCWPHVLEASNHYLCDIFSI